MQGMGIGIRDNRKTKKGDLDFGWWVGGLNGFVALMPLTWPSWTLGPTPSTTPTPNPIHVILRKNVNEESAEPDSLRIPLIEDPREEETCEGTKDRVCNRKSYVNTIPQAWETIVTIIMPRPNIVLILI